MKLSTRTFLLIGVLFATTALITSWLTANTLRTSLTDEFRSKGLVIAKGVADASTELIMSRDLATVQAVIDQFAESQGVAYVLVANDRGEVVSHTFVPGIPPQVPSLVNMPGQAHSLTDPETRNVYIDRIGEVIHVTEPILAGVMGLAAVGMDLGIIEQQIRETIIRQQAILLAIFIIAMLGALFATRRVSRPLTELATYIRGLADDGFETSENMPQNLRKLKQQSNNEVGQLATAFDEMGWLLERYIEDLRTTTATKERIESELNIAREIQMGLVPATFPAFPDRREFNLHASLKPAREVGGDFYDFFFVDEHHIRFIIADVSDKGVPASLFMALTRTLFRAIGREPKVRTDEIMSQLNREISQDNDSCMFVTAFCGVLDTRDGSIEFSNAGHNPPVLMRRDGCAFLDTTAGVALGMSADATFGIASMQLAPGDVLFMYTDGVTEAMDVGGRQFSNERLLALLGMDPEQSTSKLVDRVLEGVEQFAHGCAQSDDLTLLALRYHGAEGRDARQHYIRVAAERSGLKHLADEWKALAVRWTLPEKLVFRVRLVLDEVVTNIIDYGEVSGGESIQIRVEKSKERIGLEIRDPGRAFDPNTRAAPDTESALGDRPVGGLGIHLVRNMVDAMDYRRQENHNVLRLELAIDEPASNPNPAE